MQFFHTYTVRSLSLNFALIINSQEFAWISTLNQLKSPQGVVMELHGVAEELQGDLLFYSQKIFNSVQLLVEFSVGWGLLNIHNECLQ